MRVLGLACVEPRCPGLRSQPRQTTRRNRGRFGSSFNGRTGSSFQLAMVRTHSRACALSVMPGNRRRNSIAADSSPRCSKVARIAAASASVTTNMGESIGMAPPRVERAALRPGVGSPAFLHGGIPQIAPRRDGGVPASPLRRRCKPARAARHGNVENLYAKQILILRSRMAALLVKRLGNPYPTHMSNGSKKRLLNFRVTDAEFDILSEYCERTGRTQTDVVRELIRELAQRPTLPHRRAASPRPPAKVRSQAASIAAPVRPARRTA
jgi:hypothetical protein